MTTNLTAAPTTGITLRRATDRGQADHGWLKSAHSFSFADYHDPRHMGFRSLRVINDDVVAGGGGFPTHPHRDMEIITYVLQGALQHRDSMGNGSVIRPGNVQYMAAGSGVQHSEFNASPTDPVHLLQIWIRPNRTGLSPRYQEKSLGEATPGRLQLVASSSGREDSIAINQDADLWIGRLQSGESVLHTLAPNRHAWIQVASGSVNLNGLPLSAGDGASVSGETSLRLSASHAAQVLLFDLN
jgi:redox-sensitive bicupin YhaK (pirin superfamily)